MAKAYEFSDAGKVYAQHSETVDEMWKLFKREIARFEEALKEAVQELVRPFSVKELLKDASRSWWLAEEGSVERETQPYIWVATKDAEIISPGRLVLHVGVEGDDDALRRKVNALQGSLNLGPVCSVVKDAKTFAIIITYEDRDPVAVCVEPVAEVLRKLSEVMP